MAEPSDDTTNQLSATPSRGERMLTAAEFHRLADVPPELEWFANLSNPSTKRVYQNAVGDFMRFAGIVRPEEFRVVTRAHVIAWRDELKRRGLGGATIRHRLAAVASLFEYLCERNAVTHNPAFAPDGDVGAGRAEDVQGEPSQGCHVLRPMIASVPGSVLIEHRVENPVLAVLDPPMRPHRGGETLGRECGRGQVVSPDGAGAAVAFDSGFDHGQRGQAGHAKLVRIAALGEQPGNVVADDMAPGLDAAMVGIGCDVRLDRGVRVLEAGRDFGEHGGAVGFEGKQPFAAAFGDAARCLGLAMDRVGGDQHAGQVEQAEQTAGGGDLVAAVRHWRLADHQPGVAGERGDHVQRRGPGGTVKRAAQRLAVDRQHAAPVLAESIKQAAKASGEGRRLEQPKQARKGVVARQAVFERQELAEQPLPVAGEIGKVDATLRPADRGHQRNGQHFNQVMPGRIPSARVRQRRKTLIQPSHRPLPNKGVDT